MISRAPGSAAALPRPPLPTVLFVHGAGGGAWQFDETWLQAAANRGFPAVAVSLRGHGESEGARSIRWTTLGDYVDDVVRTIADIPGPVVVVAYSLGARVALEAASSSPMAGLALVCPTPLSNATGLALGQLARSPLAMTRGVATGRPKPTPSLLFNDLDPWQASGYADRMCPEAPLAILAAMRSTRIARPPCPTVVFGATDDRLHPRGEIEQVARDLGVEARWLRGASHTPMLDARSSSSIETVLDWVIHALR